jgi:hypothetical protein
MYANNICVEEVYVTTAKFYTTHTLFCSTGNTIDTCINHIGIPHDHLLLLRVVSKPDAVNSESLSSIMSERLHDGGVHFTVIAVDYGWREKARHGAIQSTKRSALRRKIGRTIGTFVNGDIR